MMEYNWTKIEKKSRGASAYGPHWTEYPCVAINKGGLTLNAKFCEEYLNGSTQVEILCDKGNQAICIKLVPRGEEVAGNWKIQVNNTSRGSLSPSKRVVSNKPAKMFPDGCGRAYRTALAAAGSKMHIVSVTEENRVK